MRRRRIDYDPAFDAATARFGGIAAVQKVIDPLLDAIDRRLKPEQVREIRELCRRGENAALIADRFGVKEVKVRMIGAGYIWRDIPDGPQT